MMRPPGSHNLKVSLLHRLSKTSNEIINEPFLNYFISFFSSKVQKPKAFENERDSDSSSELKIDEPTILVEDEFQPENQPTIESKVCF
jgi:hypothetical protein